MSTAILNQQPASPAVQSFKTLDEMVWRAWLDRNSAQEKHDRMVRTDIARWFCIGLLFLTTIGSFQHAFVYPTVAVKVVQFVLTIGAIAFAWTAILSRRYILAVGFMAVALLFNPLLSSLWLFRGGWPFLLLSTLPFIPSARRGKHDDKSAASLPEVSHAK